MSSSPTESNNSSITTVETFGFERIPDASRYARPIDLFRLLFGGCNTFSTSVLGSFPVLLGLSFWAGVASHYRWLKHMGRVDNGHEPHAGHDPTTAFS